MGRLGGIVGAACALVIAAAAMQVLAADEIPSAHPVPESPGPGPTIDQVRAQNADTTERVYVLGRAQLAYPLRLAFTSGVVVTRIPRDYDCTTTCLMRGATVQGTLGVSGGGVAVGYGSFVGETGASRYFLRHVYVGWGARASYLRTWAGSPVDPQGANFLGVESAVTVAQFSLTVGIYRRLGADQPGGDWRVFGGLGWGF